MKGVLLACAVVLALVRPAHAEDPWAVGVSEANKQTAEKLLDKGNAQFLEHKYPEALATYQQARQSWDHPAIRFRGKLLGPDGHHGPRAHVRAPDVVSRVSSCSIAAAKRSRS